MTASIFAAVLVLLGFGGLYAIARKGAPTTAPVMVPLVRQPATPQPTAPGMPAAPVAPVAVPPPLREVALPSPSWSKASIVLSGQPDPYNQAYANAIGQAEISRRDLGSGTAGAIGTAAIGISTAVIGAISSTGIGAVAVGIATAVYELVAHLVPASSGGFEKLAPLQRQRAVIYQLLPDFESTRNKNVWTSQHLDLTIPDLGPQTVQGTLPNFSSTKAAQTTDPRYGGYVRNVLIRLMYAFQFSRVCHTDDEAMLPGAAIIAAQQANMWPPPLQPLPLTELALRGPAANPANLQWKYFFYQDSLAKLDQIILNREHAKLTADCLADERSFYDQLSSACMCPSDIEQLAEQSGSIPELGTPAFPSRSRTGGL